MEEEICRKRHRHLLLPPIQARPLTRSLIQISPCAPQPRAKADKRLVRHIGFRSRRASAPTASCETIVSSKKDILNETSSHLVVYALVPIVLGVAPRIQVLKPLTTSNKTFLCGHRSKARVRSQPPILSSPRQTEKRLLLLGTPTH